MRAEDNIGSAAWFLESRIKIEGKMTVKYYKRVRNSLPEVSRRRGRDEPPRFQPYGSSHWGRRQKAERRRIGLEGTEGKRKGEFGKKVELCEEDVRRRLIRR